MILDVHREPLHRRIERRPLRHRPAQQHAVVLDAEVIVQVAGEMFLDAEEARLALAGVQRLFLIALGFERLLEIALLPVFIERHGINLQLKLF
jgi:hypothetical protein